MKPTRYQFNLAYLFVLLLIPMLLLSAAGCSTDQIEQYRTVKAELQAALDEAQVQLADAYMLIDELNTQIEELEEGPEKEAAIEARENIEKTIEQGKATVAELQIGIERAQTAIEAVIAGDSAAAVKAIGPYIASKTPPPWSVYILGATTLISSVLAYVQKRKKDEADGNTADAKLINEIITDEKAKAEQETATTKKAVASVIAAIENEKSDSGVVDFGNQTVKTSLRSRMSTEAKDLVEQVRQTLSANAASTKSIAPVTESSAA